MIKVKIQAGLGNQMFQYALARAIQENTGKDVVLDLSFYAPGGVVPGDIPRGYELDKYNLNPMLKMDSAATPRKDTLLEKILRRLRRESAWVFYPKYLQPKDGSHLIGFWQSEKYFQNIADVIKKEFTLKDKIENRAENDLAKEYLEKILDSKNSISVNVRRGDYAHNKNSRKYHGLLERYYYIRGVEYIVKEKNYLKEDTKIFIVSDDIVWCRENLTELKKFGSVIFVPQEISATDTIYLMSKCQNNVLANSSFSWWGAWLNENREKIVVAPKSWTRAKVKATDVCSPSWIRLDCRFY